MKTVEIVTEGGATAYVPLDFIRGTSEELWVRTDDGDIKCARKTIDLYLPNKNVPLERKEMWSEGESPYERLE